MAMWQSAPNPGPVCLAIIVWFRLDPSLLALAWAVDVKHGPVAGFVSQHPPRIVAQVCRFVSHFSFVFFSADEAR